MKRKLSCRESNNRWKNLHQVPLVANKNESHPLSAGEEDPFDCKSLAVPPTRTLVESVLEEHVQRWKELDFRKIQRQRGNKNNDAMEGGPRQLILPPNFDYRTNLASPPLPPDNDDNVLDLLSLSNQQENPKKKMYYSQELWKLFASVPTASVIQEKARSDAKIPHTISVYREIQEAMKRYSRIDAHALARLRMSDRHGLPPPQQQPSLTTNKDNQIGTIRFEFLRNQLRRGTTPDNRRMVLEFLASQTLLDVHSVIVEMLEDDLWKSTKNETNDNDDSGCFFIENTFYTTGTVDYTTPIMEWIDGKLDVPNPARRRYLGLHMDPISAKKMSETTLENIPFQIGVRYYHATHGDVETCVCVTDQRFTNHHTNMIYPVIHDIWNPSYALPICNVCERFSAEYVYHDQQKSALVVGSSKSQEKALCQKCCHQLKLFDDEESNKLHLYHVWKNQSELSTSLARQEQGRYF